MEVVRLDDFMLAAEALVVKVQGRRSSKEEEKEVRDKSRSDRVFENSSNFNFNFNSAKDGNAATVPPSLPPPPPPLILHVNRNNSSIKNKKE
jgi:hypothetical protein